MSGGPCLVVWVFGGLSDQEITKDHFCEYYTDDNSQPSQNCFNQPLTFANCQYTLNQWSQWGQNSGILLKVALNLPKIFP